MKQLNNENDELIQHLATLDDLKKMAMHNPVIHKCLSMVQYQNVSLEQALLTATYVLAKQNEHYKNELVKAMQNSSRPLF